MATYRMFSRYYKKIPNYFLINLYPKLKKYIEKYNIPNYI